MSVFVKAHRRGRSVVRAYSRAQSALNSVERRLYGNKQISPGRQKQLIKLNSSLIRRQSQIKAVLEGKLRTGAAVLGGVRYDSTPRYFSGSNHFTTRRRR